MNWYDQLRNLGNIKLAIKELFYIHELRRNQWKKPNDLQKIQLSRLKAVIRHAYYHTRYYHSLFNRARIKPDDIKSLQDLQKIPLTTKNDVQSRYLDFISYGTDLRSCVISRTTGSTGTPLKVAKDKEAVHYSAGLRHYAFFECGLQPYDKFVEIVASEPIKAYAKKEFYRCGLLGVERISIFNSTETTLKMLSQSRPDAIYTFPSVISCLLSELKKNNSGIRLKLVFSQGETLSHKCRRLARLVLGIEINDTYGSAEFSRLAFECNEHTGLHMITDCAAMEFLKDEENVNLGEEGEIVVTGLYNYAMPLIRFRLGDVGIPLSDKCSCGRSWPLIKSIEGRTDDFLVLPSGDVISPRSINVIDYIDGINHYQIIQEEKDRFLVKLVKDESFSEKTAREVERQISLGCFGEKVSIEVQIVEEIPRERTGKIRTVISKVRR